MLDCEIKRILYNGKKNVLWGAGKNGIQALLALASQGVLINSFCDSDSKKQGIRIFNKQVVDPEKILKDQSEYNFVVTVGRGECSKEITEILEKEGAKNYLTWNDIRGIINLTISNLEVNSTSNRINLYHMIRDSYVKKLIIYGTGKEAVALKKLLQMFGVEIAYFVDETESAYRQWGNEVRNVYELLYEEENTYKVIVMTEKREKTDILNKMGLAEGIDFDWCGKYTMSIKRKYILDANLGYNFLPMQKDNKTPGIVEIGDGDFVIAMLGGSTTDGELYSFKTWGEILYEKLTENGYSVKILNGGCAGYTTSQELVKLARDIIPIRPNVVIDYTGANDNEYQGVEYPFVHEYQKELVGYMAEHIKYINALMETDDRFTLGINYQRQCFQVFADNIRMMSSICSGFGITYLAFLQPWMGTKQDKISKYEYEFMHNCGWDSRPSASWFCENAWELVSGYAEDITSLFDDEPDVYIDYVHVSEHGNELIAQYMYDYLTEKEIVKK